MVGHFLVGELRLECHDGGGWLVTWAWYSATMVADDWLLVSLFGSSEV